MSRILTRGSRPEILAFWRSALRVAGGAVLLGLAACGKSGKESGTAVDPARPWAAALVTEPGDGATDREIRRCQEKVRSGIKREAWIERLGWAFVAKAQESFDPGYYKLAEVCADALDAARPGSAEELLLRGHVLDSEHRFKEAEALARKLVARRGLSFDYALLGDALMEQGRIAESIPVYQKAMDLRPDLQSYARAGHVRWLLGDVDGAIEMLKAAVGASSPVDPASVAWTRSRLAALEFQAGDNPAATAACRAALAAMPGYPTALLLQGKMRLAEGSIHDAIPLLSEAAKEDPLPEPQWALADALRAAGREAEAAKMEASLCERGVMSDPRTVSLFLATRGRDPQLAVRLAEQELMNREDVFTHDALAWALVAANRLPEASTQMDVALSAGTIDARLYFHAAVIAARTGSPEAAREWVAQLGDLEQTLLPSERDRLSQLRRQLDAAAPGKSLPAAETKAAEKPKPETAMKS